MSNFDLSLIGEADEKMHRKMFKIPESDNNVLVDYVNAVNAAREAKGMKPIDEKYLMPKLLMRGIDTEKAELPDYLTQKMRKSRKRKNEDGQQNDNDGSQSIPQAAE